MKFGFVPLPIQSKHWIAVRRINDVYYNLDSKLDAPEPIGADVSLKEFLKKQKSHFVGVEIFLIVTKAVEESHSWEEAEVLEER